MYAQTVRTPIVRRYEHPTPLTIMNMFKSVHFQNRKCDCIKSLKLGEINTQRLIQFNGVTSRLNVEGCARHFEGVHLPLRGCKQNT